MTKEQLLQEMERLMAAGDKKGYDAFMLEHFTEFSEDVQGKILMGFYSEMLDNREAEAAVAELQQQGISALEKIEQVRAAIEKGE